MSLQCQYGELGDTNYSAGICWRVWGTPANFKPVSHLGFLTAPISINGGQQNFAECLAVSWAGTLYITLWGLLHLNGILSGAKFTLRPNLALSSIGSVTARHTSSGLQPNFVVWYKE